MSDAVGPGDLVLCVNASPNHMTGEAASRGDALLDVGIDFAWRQTRFRLLPKPKFNAVPKRAPVPIEKV